METTASKFARRYDREFKENAVALVTAGKTITEVARDLGVSHWSLNRWVHMAREGRGQSQVGTVAIGGFTCLAILILVGGYPGLYALVGASACMSLMFPTIYGIALRGLGDDAKLESAGLICAIGGGCVMPPLQAVIMDGAGITLGALSLSATRISFLLPLFCFVVIAIYGWANFLASSRNAVTSA